MSSILGPIKVRSRNELLETAGCLKSKYWSFKWVFECSPHNATHCMMLQHAATRCFEGSHQNNVLSRCFEESFQTTFWVKHQIDVWSQCMMFWVPHNEVARTHTHAHTHTQLTLDAKGTIEAIAKSRELHYTHTPTHTQIHMHIRTHPYTRTHTHTTRSTPKAP